MFADPQISDKPTGSDLANGRPTLPVLMAYQTDAAETRLAMGAAWPGARPSRLNSTSFARC